MRFINSAVQEELTTLERLPLQVSSKSVEHSQRMESAYLDLSPVGYERFIEWDAFDYMTRPTCYLNFRLLL